MPTDRSGGSVQTDNASRCDLDYTFLQITAETFLFGTGKLVYALTFCFPLHVQRNGRWGGLRHSWGGRGQSREMAERQLCKPDQPGYLLAAAKGKTQFNFIRTR